MKRKEIDVFAIIIGIVIGFLFGYFLSLRINTENTDKVGVDNPVYGNVHLLQIMKSNDISEVHNKLEDVDFNYQIIENGTTYYVYVGISNKKENLEAMIVDYEAYGFMPIIKTEYILDWPNYYSDNQTKFDFYEHVIENLIKSLKGESFQIDEKYYQDPIDLGIFSNMTLMQSIINPDIKMQIQLETYQLLYSKLN